MHRSVLLEEVLICLDPKPGDRVLDGTLGSAGHARALLEKIGSQGLLIGLDRDDDALRRAREKIGCSSNVIIAKANFKDLDRVLYEHGLDQVDAVLLDLGVSSDQLETAERGFSFRQEGPLDMRMDREQEVSAAVLVNGLSQEELADIFFQLGEERKSRLIARRIVERRRQKEFRTTTELAEAVRSCFPGHSRIHPATRVFQALRIAVNGELDALVEALEKGINALKPGGRMAVISFHSLEDRIVKRRFRQGYEAGTLKMVTKKAVIPGSEEIEANPRSRSAKLRAVERA